KRYATHGETHQRIAEECKEMMIVAVWEERPFSMFGRSHRLHHEIISYFESMILEQRRRERAGSTVGKRNRAAIHSQVLQVGKGGTGPFPPVRQLASKLWRMLEASRHDCDPQLCWIAL